MQLGVTVVIQNSARTWQKCIVAERRELLRDSRRHEKGVTRIIGEYLPIEHRTEKKKNVEDGIREFYKRTRKVGDARERLGWATCPGEILGHYFGLVPPCVRPPEMNMQEPSGEYLRRAPIRVRRVPKDEADQNRRGSSAREVTSRIRAPGIDLYW